VTNIAPALYAKGLRSGANVQILFPGRLLSSHLPRKEVAKAEPFFKEGRILQLDKPLLKGEGPVPE
jgi:hypothetical protein